MSLRHLFFLPLFAALLVAISSIQSVLLSALSANIFAYAWIYLTWQVNARRVAICFGVFAIVIGPLTYFGFRDVRVELVSLGYSWLQVYSFQPLAALVLPAVSLIVRLREADVSLNPFNYVVRSSLEMVIGLPLLMLILTFVP